MAGKISLWGRTREFLTAKTNKEQKKLLPPPLKKVIWHVQGHYRSEHRGARVLILTVAIKRGSS